MARRRRRKPYRSSDSTGTSSRRRGESKNLSRSDTRRKTLLWRWLPAITLLVAVVCCGYLYHGRQTGTLGETETAPDLGITKGVNHRNNGANLLRNAASRYRESSSYADQAQLVFRYDGPDGPLQEVTDLWVKYARPNKLWLEVVRPPSRVRLAIDGELARAWVDDPETNDFDRQLVERPAPAELNVPFVYSATEYVEPSDTQKLLSVLIGLRIPLEVSPLGILLSPDAFDQFVDAAQSIRELPSQTAFGSQCQRIELVAAQGTFVFWMERSEQALRRIEYPVNGQADGSALNRNARPPVSLRLDLPRVDFGPRLVAQDFHLPSPTGAQRVRHLVLPPDTQIPPSLGKRVPPFQFTELSGGVVESEGWPEAYLVLTWFAGHPQSLATLQQMDAVHERYQNDPNVQVIAVCSEPSTRMSHADVERLINRWNLHLPVVRDLDAVGRDLFAIDRSPTLIVLDPQRNVQLFEVGGNPQMADQVPQVIEQLMQGRDIADEYIAFLQQQKKQYQRMVAAASVDAPQRSSMAETTAIAERSQPQRLRLTQLWNCREVRDPGNLTVTSDANGDETLLVHDGWREIVRLTLQGRVANRYRLDVPPDAAIQSLRSGVDRRGERYFVATSRGARQLYVFNSQWQLVGRYPEELAAQDGIADVQIADLDSDGSLELYVAFAGQQGVHRTDLRGSVQWQRKTDMELLSLAVSRPPGSLLVTHPSGSLLPLSQQGQFGSAIAVGSRAIYHLKAQAADQSRPTMFCGISHGLDGRNVAIGLDSQLHESWSYPLPIGQHVSQVHPVGSVQLVDESTDWQWLFAGADGSIHIVSDDGGFHDHFNYGAQLTGLTATRAGGQSLLFVATPKGVAAWRVTGTAK